MESKKIFLDLETTGLDVNRHGIIQISGIVEIGGKVVEEFDFSVKPYPLDEISADAVAVNGYKADRVGLLPSEAYSKVIDIFSRHIDRYNKLDKFILVGQNPAFDYNFLDKFFKKNRNDYLYAYINYRKIDLITISAFLSTAGLIKLKSCKLIDVAEAVGVPLVAHNALNDVRAVREIFYKFIALVSPDSQANKQAPS